MKIKTILLVILLCPAPYWAAADESVINLIENPGAEYAFAEGASILEIVFPRVHSSDCAILRIDDQVMMIDASTPGAKMQARIKSALEAMNVTHIDIAFNTHPHNDHIGGFSSVYETAPFDVIQVAFPEDFNKYMIDALEFARANNVEIQQVRDGNTLTLGEAGQVVMHVIQRDGVKWSENDQSAMLMIIYGERSILFSADIENHAQADYAANPPPCGIDADILKYPHHGIVRMNSDFFNAVSPKIVFTNGGLDSGRSGRDYLKRKKQPYLVGYKGLTRMRTDGRIWVIDYLEEIVTDR